MKSMMIQQKNGTKLECVSLLESHFYQLLLRDLEFAPEDEKIIKKLAFKEMLQEMYEAVVQDKNVRIEYESTSEKEQLLKSVLEKIQTIKDIEIQ